MHPLILFFYNFVTKAGWPLPQTLFWYIYLLIIYQHQSYSSTLFCILNAFYISSHLTILKLQWRKIYKTWHTKQNKTKWDVSFFFCRKKKHTTRHKYQVYEVLLSIRIFLKLSTLLNLWHLTTTVVEIQYSVLLHCRYCFLHKTFLSSPQNSYET